MVEVNIALVSYRYIWSWMFNFSFFSAFILWDSRSGRNKKEKYLSPNRIFLSHGIPKSPSNKNHVPSKQSWERKLSGGARRRETAVFKSQKILFEVTFRSSCWAWVKTRGSLLLPNFTFLFLLLFTYTHHSISLCLARCLQQQWAKKSEQNKTEIPNNFAYKLYFQSHHLTLFLALNLSSFNSSRGVFVCSLNERFLCI